MYFDPMAARFAQQQQPLAPWQMSAKLFDFDEGFVKWIQKYLEKRTQPFDVVSAKAWINKSKFQLERYELCELQWAAYQESLQPPAPSPAPKPEQPTLKPKPVSGPVGVVGGGVAASAEPERDLVPVDPDTVRLQDETDQEYRLRMVRQMREKMTKIGKWKS